MDSFQAHKPGTPEVESVMMYALRFSGVLSEHQSIYVAAVCAISFISVTLLRETRHVDLHRAIVAS